MEFVKFLSESKKQSKLDWNHLHTKGFAEKILQFLKMKSTDPSVMKFTGAAFKSVLDACLYDEKKSGR